MQRIWREWRDERAVRYVLSGEQEYFAALIHRYQRPAWAIACAISGNTADADDIVQDAFIRAYRHLDTLEAPQRFGAWLMSIVRNTALNFRSRHRTHVGLDHASEEALAASTDHSERELFELLHAALGDLETTDRELLTLRYFTRHPVREIARLLEISPAAAAKRLERARARVGDKLLGRLGQDAQDFPATARNARAILGLVLEQGAAWAPVAPAANSIAVMATLTALVLVIPSLLLLAHWGSPAADNVAPPMAPPALAEFTQHAMAISGSEAHLIEQHIQVQRDQAFDEAVAIVTVTLVPTEGATLQGGKLRAHATGTVQQGAKHITRSSGVWPTESDDTFLVTIPPGATRLGVTAASDTHYGTAQEIDVPEADASIEILLDQTYSASLSGRIILPANALLPEWLQVNANWEEGPKSFGVPLGTDGGFHFPALPAGTFRFGTSLSLDFDLESLSASIGPFMGLFDMGTTIHLDAGEQREDVEIPIGDRGPLSIAGELRDVDGSPVAGALIFGSSMPHRAVSDADGFFRLVALPSYPPTLNIKAEGYIPQAINHPGAALTARLVPTWTLHGQILDPEGHAHPASVTVTQDTIFGVRQRSVNTDKDGCFTLPSLEADEVRLAVNVEGFWTVNRRFQREGHQIEADTTIEVIVRDMVP